MFPLSTIRFIPVIEQNVKIYFALSSVSDGLIDNKISLLLFYSD